jgi:hypothetical protein
MCSDSQSLKVQPDFLNLDYIFSVINIMNLICLVVQIFLYLHVF